MLTGQWGGPLIYLDAQASGVQLRFPCMLAELPALALDPAGHFEGATKKIWASFAATPTELLLSGDVAGSEMTLAITYVTPMSQAAEPQHYTLRLGTLPDFSGVACLL